MSDQLIQTVLMVALMIGVFYFLIIRPNQQRIKAHQAMINSIRRGDTVVTSGGIIGKVSKVVDDNEAIVEIAENVKVRVMKTTVTEVRSKGEPAANASADNG